MYKNLLTISLFAVMLFLVSCPAKAQQLKNPDGETVSIHFTPYLTDSKAKILDKEGSVDQTFNFDLKLKLPLSSDVTASIFYKSEDFELGYIEVKKKSYGVTLSYYFE